MWGLGYFMFCLVWVNDSSVFVSRCRSIVGSDVVSSVVIRRSRSRRSRSRNTRTLQTLLASPAPANTALLTLTLASRLSLDVAFAAVLALAQARLPAFLC